MNQNRSITSYKFNYIIPTLNSNSSLSTRNLNASDMTGSAISSNKISWFKRNWKILLCAGILLFLLSISGVFGTLYAYLNNRTAIGNFDHTIADENVTNTEKSPWLVRIQYSNGTHSFYGCTGFIISDDEILTAAHCVLNVTIFELHIGGTSINNFTDMIRIPGSELNSIPHPEFEFGKFSNIADIGLIKLKEKLQFSEAIHPISLPTDESKLPEKFTMNVWTTNQTFDMSMSERLVTFVDSKECYEIYNTKGGGKELNFHRNGAKKQIIFCADSKGYIPQGTSGTPALVRKENTTIAYGILSLGGSENTAIPNVFVDIRAHLDWIDSFT